MLPSFLYYKHAHKDLSPVIGEVICAACSDKQPIHALNMSHVSFCYLRDKKNQFKPLFFVDGT